MSESPSSNGRLYGVGLGPGDPDLVTIKAAKIIAAVPVVAYFAKKGARGKARAILDRWLIDTSLQLPLFYPLTTEAHFCDPAYVEELRGFYEKAEAAIAAHLLASRDVALVCEGDPLFYGSFMHLYVRLKDRFTVEIVPGVTGMSGCWSAAKTPMAWGDDVLSVLPGTLDRAALIRHLGAADAVVIIKIGANLAKSARRSPRPDASPQRFMSNMARVKRRRSFRLPSRRTIMRPISRPSLFPAKAGGHECAGKFADRRPRTRQ